MRIETDERQKPREALRQRRQANQERRQANQERRQNRQAMTPEERQQRRDERRKAMQEMCGVDGIFDRVIAATQRLTAVDIPFFSMVWLFLKWSLASIPAMILLGLLGARAWAEGVGGLLTLKLSSLASTLPFALMLLVLLLRPQGLLGDKS